MGKKWGEKVWVKRMNRWEKSQKEFGRESTKTGLSGNIKTERAEKEVKNKVQSSRRRRGAGRGTGRERGIQLWRGGESKSATENRM